eukprot:1327978-Prymnesium_polylepis.1
MLFARSASGALLEVLYKISLRANLDVSVRQVSTPWQQEDAPRPSGLSRREHACGARPTRRGEPAGGSRDARPLADQLLR